MIIVRKILLVVLMCSLCLSGCSKKKLLLEKVKDIEYTVVDKTDISEEILELINDKKEKEFSFTYKDGGYMYLCVGYGKQPTGGYSINIKELYQTKNSIYLDTTLIGPKENELVLMASSYPYIVIKIEDIDYTVIFGNS